MKTQEPSVFHYNINRVRTEGLHYTLCLKQIINYLALATDCGIITLIINKYNTRSDKTSLIATKILN